jgi:two-component system response regulator FixJ
MNQIPTIHIVDDDPGMRKSLQMVMQAASIPTCVYESAEAFLSDLNPEMQGCVVLDLRMPGMGGLELLRHLRETHHDIPVIVISAHADVPAAVRSMKLGAVDLLQKPFEPQMLLELVRRALASGVEIHHRRMQEDAVRKRLSELTAREMDLLKLIVAGHANKQIATLLSISVKTVANHRANLMAKTGALNAADLTRISMLAGIQTE